MNMKTTGIYKIENLENGKVYIGSSKNIEARFRVHKYRLRHDKHHSPHLQKSYNLNPDKFEFQVIEIIEDLSHLESREQYWVDLYKSYESNSGYNAVRTVSRTDPERQRERWAKTGEKEKQSKRMKAICSTPEHRKKLSDGHIEYFKDPKNRFKKILESPLRKRVRVVETGQVFESINHASKELGVSIVTIRDGANKKRKTQKFTFEWEDDG